MLFYVGTHMINHAGSFERSFISVSRLMARISDFAVNDWILDSGAFSELYNYGHFRQSVSEYAQRVSRWAKCGNLELAVSQDYMCEPFVLAKTGLTVAEHQRLTIERYDNLMRQTEVPVMPVLQGYVPDDYVRHLTQYSSRLREGMRVGVGSVCKRNGNPAAIIQVLTAIKRERSDLRLHGFGLKVTSLRDAYITSLLYSADSMAWSFAARRQGRDRNGLNEALRFTEQIVRDSGKRGRQLELLG